ncbi:MAG: tRNA dihydrouridine synthase DusB [Flavobacteriales bacterium]|nr:tRNA dihydrouridine synthase DusB [Flavobacteriales bacterium]MBP6696639.1 tRNA dihydrouridine synthase DusB [Flavobacteriales bacterium]
MPRIGPIDLGEFPLLLAPMEDVSDPPFRALCKQHGADLMFTEFISSEGLIRQAAKGMKKLDIFEQERPIGIQLFGGSEDAMEEAARIAEAVRPDLIDINYGCPVNKVVNKGAGACLLQDVDKMVRLTDKVVKAVKVPVTVKTRLGWSEQTKNIMEVAERLQDVGIQALSIHGRTRAQLYKGPADWTLIGEVKNNPRIHIPIFGNGDIDSPEKAVEYRERYGVDGVMIGRASIGHPFIFREIKHYMATGQHLAPPTIAERVEAARTHLRSSIAWKGMYEGVVEMRRHYGNYLKGLPNVKEMRLRLCTERDPALLENLLDEVIGNYAAEAA